MSRVRLYKLPNLAAAALGGVLAGFFMASSPAAAAERVVPGSRADVEMSFAPLVERAAPAVVNIYARRVVRSAPSSPFLDDPLFKRFFGDDFSFGMPRERIQRSLGSGVIVRADGLVVTNHHVISKAEAITVVLADRREFEAEIVGTDEQTDLAVLRINAGKEKLAQLELRDSDELKVGDIVLAIGNPFGVGQTVTSGIVSALARTTVGISDFSFFIQTDAAINPGNSGGALIGLDGRLVGVNTAIYSRSGGSVGIGFAIPTNMVATVIESATKGGKVVRPWLGAAGQGVTADIAASLGLSRPAGVLVSRVYPASAADRAGLKVGDVVLSINGRDVFDLEALRFRVATQPVGAKTVLAVRRAGRMLTLEATALAPPEVPPRNLTELTGHTPLAGAEVANLSPALAEEMSADPFQSGVIVTRLQSGGAAERLRFRRGDIVVSINGRAIMTVAELNRVLAEPVKRWDISIRRDGKLLNRTING